MTKRRLIEFLITWKVSRIYDKIQGKQVVYMGKKNRSEDDKVRMS